jgi:2,3-bisphosphoglycerate-independent phosphoglycerate mutase
LILDGLGDEPSPALDGRTPLAAAHTPTLRRLASSGGQGQVSTADDGAVPHTDDGIMALLGAREATGRHGRGLYEALGQGVPIAPGSVMLRGNLATVDADGSIIDRRAGRIREGVNELLSELSEVPLSGGLVGRIIPGHEHRVLVMLVGSGLSEQVSDTDPGELLAGARGSAPVPLDQTPEAARTAEALRELLRIARKKLNAHPINQARLAKGLPQASAVLTRGAARAPLIRAGGRRAGVMIAGCRTALGVARYVGLRTHHTPDMTGNLDTNLTGKFESAGELLREHDLVVMHIKGTDVAAHDLKPLEKRDFIESVDRALALFLSRRLELSGKLRVVVAADHGTSSITGNHLPDPVPLLLSTWQADDEDEEDFDERSCARGALGVLQSGDLADLLGIDHRSAASI